MTEFFVPGVEPGQAETRYRELAEVAGGEVAEPADRIRSLRFVQGAEEWTATVGEPLSGRLGAPGRRASGAARRVTDPATVQAIFRAGDAYRVLTDAPPHGTVTESTWDNPITVTHRDTRAVAGFDA